MSRVDQRPQRERERDPFIGESEEREAITYLSVVSQSALRPRPTRRVRPRQFEEELDVWPV